jgi:Flp pilus assembly CpaF family ATPase
VNDLPLFINSKKADKSRSFSVKKYLAENLLRALESEVTSVAQRAAFIQRNFIHVYKQTRLKVGQRKVTAITEMAGMEGDIIVVSDIFKFTQTGVTTDGKVLAK